MKFVIHSKSERGFWHNKLGWVYGAAQATKFTKSEKSFLRLPLSTNNDAEWYVYKYEE